MKIGIYDGDIFQPNSKPFPNLEVMKLSSFYKNKGCIVELAPTLMEIKNYDKFFIRKDRKRGKIDKEVLINNNLHYGGLFFSNNIYTPLKKEIEEMTPDPIIYMPFLREKLLMNKFTEGQVKQFISTAYIRIFYEDWIYDYPLQHRQSVILYDVDITSNKDWREQVNHFFEISGKKVKILHPVIARSIEDLVYLCETKPFFSDRPTKIVIDLEEIETDFEKFLFSYKEFLQKYGGQMLFIYINKFYKNKMPYDKYIVEILNKVFLARSEGVKLNLLFIPSDFYNPYDKIMTAMADWFYMQPNTTFRDRFMKVKNPILLELIDKICETEEGKNTFLTNLSDIKKGGSWDYGNIRIKE